MFALPLYTTRLAYHEFAEIRDMFTQTIGALAEAVDKRDPFTSKHSRNVMEISRDIGRVMRLSDADLEALEWGGLLHDVGKIGVPDNVLLKPERLTKDERMLMNSHPVLGAEIIAPVARLSRELPIIRNHHEWYNGSGYPDRLIGDEIPLLARVLHVADAFEAMTAARPYRMTPLTAEQALGELRKFAGIQFDPRIVDAFVKTHWVEGVPDPGAPAAAAPDPSDRAARGAGGRRRDARLRRPAPCLTPRRPARGPVGTPQSVDADRRYRARPRPRPAPRRAHRATRGYPPPVSAAAVRGGDPPVRHRGPPEPGVAPVEALRMPLFALSYGLLLFTLWHNRGYPGLALAFVGIASNGLVIIVNGGWMPVWMPACRRRG